MKKRILFTIACLALGAGPLARADVNEIYGKQCAKCHGADGKGETKMGKKAGVKDYTDPKVQAELKDEKAFKSVKEGITEGDKTLMKPAEGLSDDDIKGLIGHMRSFKK